MKFKNIQTHFSTELVFVMLALFFGAYFALATPVFWGIDESTHFLRAYQISQGGTTAKQVGKSYGGEFPKNLVALRLQVGRDLTSVLPPPKTVVGRHDFHDGLAYQKLTGQPLSHIKKYTDIVNAEVYSPAAYVPSILTIKAIGWMHPDIQVLVYACRIVGLFLYILIVALALRILAFSRLKWLVFCVGLLPTALYQASIVTADTDLNALCLLAFALLASGFIKKKALEKWELSMLIVASIVVPLIKLNYALLTIPLALLPTINYKKIKLPHWWVRAFILFFGLILGLIWLHMTNQYSNELSNAVVNNDPISVNKQIQFITHQPVSFISDLMNTIGLNWTIYASQAAGFFGWDYVQMPTALVITSYALLFSAGFYQRPKRKNKKKIVPKKIGWISITLGLVTIFIILSVFYVSYSGLRAHYVRGVQGRYLIPTLPFIFYGIGRVIPIPKSILKRLKLSDLQVSFIFAGLNFLCLLGAAIYYSLAVY